MPGWAIFLIIAGIAAITGICHGLTMKRAREVELSDEKNGIRWAGRVAQPGQIASAVEDARNDGG